MKYHVLITPLLESDIAIAKRMNLPNLYIADTWALAQQMLAFQMKIYEFDYAPAWIDEYNPEALYEWENERVVISIERV